MSKTFSSISFGCRVNQAEKEALDRQLLLAGLTQNHQDPDVYIINTCAVTQKAEREARQFIYQTRRKMPRTKIVVTGCAATKWIIEKEDIKEADELIPNTAKEFAASLILKRLEGTNKLLAPNTPRAILQRDKFSKSGRFLLKIQDGCHRFCTFCIVPYLRGRPQSVSSAEIIQTIKTYQSAVKEIILTAINTEAYGYDSGTSFSELVETILEKTTIARLSFGSIHPWTIKQDFFDLYKKSLTEGRLVKFFHIPLQSGSNKILTLMKRGYTREEFIEKLKTLADFDPFTFIGTDIIVGFLEEEEKDFTDTYEFLRDSPISKFHIFRYSKREKTAGYFMSKRLKNVSPATKKKRAKLLAELSQKKYTAFLQKHVGKTFPALFLEKREDGYQSVLLDNQIPAVIKTNSDKTGKIHTVCINKLHKTSLIGILII